MTFISYFYIGIKETVWPYSFSRFPSNSGTSFAGSKALNIRLVQNISLSEENNVIIVSAWHYFWEYMLHARPSVTNCHYCK